MAMLPRLDAEERLDAIDTRGVAAMRKLSRHDAQRAIRMLQRAAKGGPVKAAKATPDALAAMGISVAHV